MPLPKPTPRRRIPQYRVRAVRGKNLALVALTDSATHQRREYWLGEDGPEARQKYVRLMTAWESAGRRLPLEQTEGLTIIELACLYLRWAKGYYADPEYQAIKSAADALTELYGQSAAIEFGPVQARLVRERMIARGWCRKYVNKQMQRMAAAFRWGASHGHVPVTVFQGIKTIEPLKRGHTTAPESKPVKPVEDAHVDAIEPFVSRPVWAMIQLQRLTGARPGELALLRKGDIDRSGEIWLAQLSEHKTAHQGRTRTVAFGPRAQAILQPFLFRADGEYLFSPVEAERDRHKRAKLHRHQAVLKPVTDRILGEHYTTPSYRRAIARACDAADRWAKAGRVVGNEERLVPRWHPHQLRHNAATQIRRQFGLEAAQVVLGHSSALVTDAVYAERDLAKVVEVLRAIG